MSEKNKPKIGWMDSITFDHELGCAPSVRVHDDKEECERQHPCIKECAAKLEPESYDCRAMRVYVFDADEYDRRDRNQTK
jgi:hypothetical protein